MHIELNAWLVILSIVISFCLGMFMSGKLQDSYEMQNQIQMAVMREKQIMREREMVINRQRHLVSRLREVMHEIQRSADQYVASITEYCYLKEIDNSWFDWLSRQQEARMYQLENYLGLDECPDVNLAVNVVKQTSDKALRALSFKLGELEDALDEMDINKMKKLQKEMNTMELSTFLNRQTDFMKSQLVSTSRALQVKSRGGALWQIAALFYNILKAVYSRIM